MAEMARNVSKNMSRQLSSVMSRVGHAMEARPQRDPYARGAVPRIYSNLSEEETLRLRAQAYRRSRIRLVARKWRLGRVRPNPIIYLVGIMTAIVLVVMLSVGGGAGGVYAVSYYQRHLGDIQAIAGLRDTQNSTIYDRNGKIIYFARGDSNFQTYLPLSQISLKLQAATIDTEDRTFYSNDGVDLYGTLRAALADVRAGGQAAQGGSTITQQLVKNIVLNDTTQTIQRKLNEAILAYGVTQQYTKSFILEMYLNTIAYGELNTGIEAAARNFFNLSSYNTPNGVMTANEQLSWPQAAILAALPNAPTEYQPDVFSCPKAPCQTSQWSNPFAGDPSACGSHISTFGQDWYTNPQNGHEWLIFCRAELVLYNVYQYGVPGHPEMDLTFQGYQQAVEQLANILVNQQVYSWQNSKTSVTGQSTNLAPHFVEYIANQLDDQFGITDLSTAGLRIYTTLDYSLQQEAVKVVQNYIEKPFTETWYPNPYAANYNLPLSDPANGNAHNGALVAIDQRTGDILAMVGSVDYNSKDRHVQGANNITTSPFRSMGSATKPLMYATAFQMGWTPGIMLQDQPVCFPNPAVDPATNKPVESPVAPSCKGWYVPQDYEEANFSGTFPLRSQFDGSLNIAATEAMEFVGATPATSGNFISMVNRLGVTTISKDAMGPTTALGTQDIPLLQLTSAYGTFANLGKRAPARGILKITKNDGTVLWQAPEFPQTQQAISAQAAYMVTSVLTDNPARAPFFKVHNPLVLDDDPKYKTLAIAAKTGTSSGNGGPLDIVTAGYSPYMTLGVWVGNTDGNDPLNPGIIGIAGAGYIFHDVMDWAANHFNWDQNATFSTPPDMARGVFNCNTGLAPYQGSTAKDLNCAWVPISPNPLDPKYYSYDPYSEAGYGATDQTHRPDTDWYIIGDQPITS
jgi:membrane peptidoglycan carboxypeptidase